MQSSFVLANWYLRKMDRFIVDRMAPLYYGRYVDDILIVLNVKTTTAVSRADIVRTTEYFGKYGIKPPDEINQMHSFISKYLSNLICPRASGPGNGFNYAIQIKGLANQLLQEEKLFIYQFDGRLSAGIVNKFVEDQQKRSSEFRFLSDEEDENFEDFDEYFFGDNLDVDELNKARFKIVEENKFKLSVYLAKLIQRKMERGSGYKPEEEKKVSVYFKGAFLIKHYIFWEKLFTLYVAAGNKDLFVQLHSDIDKAIASLTYTGEIKMTALTIRSDLRQYLRYALEMALGLRPEFLSPGEIS